MTLDKDYFDSINIELVKKKYYNASKVTAVLDDIRIRARQLLEENRQLKAQLEKLNAQRNELSNSVFSAQRIGSDMIAKANAEAERIIAEAHRQSREIENQSLERQNYAVKCVEQCMSKLREQQQNTIELLNLEWQNFLIGLEAAPPLPFDDIGEKLEGIKNQIDSINEEEE